MQRLLLIFLKQYGKSSARNDDHTGLFMYIQKYRTECREMRRCGFSPLSEMAADNLLKGM
jgi:hypothetical protein